MSTSVNLVLQGGGVKGIGLVGAISVLEEAGYVFDRVAGTSAGAIVGSLVAGGMSSAELHELMVSLDYERFRDKTALDRAPVVGDELSLWFFHGVYSGNFVHKWIADQLARLHVSTFKDLAYAGQVEGIPTNQRYRLVVITSDVSAGVMRRLPWDYGAAVPADAQPVADAVRASMSIPFFFRPFQLRIEGKKVSVCVDGGMLSNFPVDIFTPFDGSPPVLPTIAIRLSARAAANPDQYKQIKGDIGLVMAMLGTMENWYDRMHENDPAYIARTIFVDTFGVNATDFSIDRATQERLYQSGRLGAENFLERL